MNDKMDLGEITRDRHRSYILTDRIQITTHAHSAKKLILHCITERSEDQLQTRRTNGLRETN